MNKKPKRASVTWKWILIKKCELLRNNSYQIQLSLTHWNCLINNSSVLCFISCSLLIKSKRIFFLSNAMENDISESFAREIATNRIKKCNYFHNAKLCDMCYFRHCFSNNFISYISFCLCCFLLKSVWNCEEEWDSSHLTFAMHKCNLINYSFIYLYTHRNLSHSPLPIWKYLSSML